MRVACSALRVVDMAVGYTLCRESGDSCLAALLFERSASGRRGVEADEARAGGSIPLM